MNQDEPTRDHVITFVIPVRHQDNAADWSRLKANLTQTIASISAQSAPSWRAVIVANHGADLPALPANFEARRVDFAPNPKHEQGSSKRIDFLDAFRIDKGRRVLAGMLTQPSSKYFMTVDDDDFVHRDLTRFVTQNDGPPGWMIDRGYLWNDGGKLLFAHDDFNHVCGTSLIIRADLFDLPATESRADPTFVSQMLGSHRDVDSLLAERGTPLQGLPFRGAIYRVGHAGSHSQMPGFMKTHVMTNGWYRYPRAFIGKLRRLSLLNGRLKAQFFGSS